MSETVRINLTRVGGVVAILSALGLFVSAWVVLPYRVAAAEKRIESLEVEARTARELLVRIDENVKALKERPR